MNQIAALGAATLLALAPGVDSRPAEYELAAEQAVVACLCDEGTGEYGHTLRPMGLDVGKELIEKAEKVGSSELRAQVLMALARNPTIGDELMVKLIQASDRLGSSDHKAALLVVIAETPRYGWVD